MLRTADRHSCHLDSMSVGLGLPLQTLPKDSMFFTTDPKSKHNPRSRPNSEPAFKDGVTLTMEAWHTRVGTHQLATWLQATFHH